MVKVAKRRPPSRVRYEQSHPTISCRISRELYDRLTAAKEVDGKSFADILKLGLGVADDHVEKVAEARQLGLTEGRREGFEEAKEQFWDSRYKEGRSQGWNDGHHQGFIQATNRYGVAYNCSVCGKPLWVENDAEKKIIAVHCKEWGFGHEECREKRIQASGRH